MPRSRLEKEKVAQEIIERYADGAVTKVENFLVSNQTLKELIQNLSDDILKDPDIIEIYKKRLRASREGTRPEGFYEEPKLTLEEVGKHLGISTVMVAAKEGANKDKPLVKIDRNDLLCFCMLYQVSPHYLLGLVNHSSEYKIPREQLIPLPNSSRSSEDKQREPSKKCTKEFPIMFPSTAVQSRGQIIIYRLKENQEFLQLLIRLAKASQRVQQIILSRFENSASVTGCQIEKYLAETATEEFRNEWLRFVVSAPNQDQRIEQMKTLAEVGLRNFDILDFIAKVSVCDTKTQKMVQLVLEDDYFFQNKGLGQNADKA